MTLAGRAVCQPGLGLASTEVIVISLNDVVVSSAPTEVGSLLMTVVTEKVSPFAVIVPVVDPPTKAGSVSAGVHFLLRRRSTSCWRTAIAWARELLPML